MHMYFHVLCGLVRGVPFFSCAKHIFFHVHTCIQPYMLNSHLFSPLLLRTSPQSVECRVSLSYSRIHTYIMLLMVTDGGQFTDKNIYFSKVSKLACVHVCMCVCLCMCVYMYVEFLSVLCFFTTSFFLLSK